MNVLQKRKLGILNFTAAAGLDPGAALLLYLIAAADPQDSVSRYCSKVLPCSLDSTVLYSSQLELLHVIDNAKRPNILLAAICSLTR